MKNIVSKNLLADKDIEQFIGLQLRYGVIISCLIVFVGGVIYLGQSGQLQLPAYHHFIGTKAGYTSFGEILKGVIGVSPKGIIQFGVVILIATPIFRIAFSLIGFVLEKDKMYILITTIVLTVMMASIFSGFKI